MGQVMTAKQAKEKYGDPMTSHFEQTWMSFFYPDPKYGLPFKRIYAHKDFIPVLKAWFEFMDEADVIGEIKTFDGCFNIRKQRGGTELSLHSWGLAVDFNASQNPLTFDREEAIHAGLKPFSKEFLNVAREFVDCGADFKRLDLMHFQKKSYA